MSRLAACSAAVLAGLVFLLPAARAGIDRDQAASLAHRKASGQILAVERGLHVDSSVVWRVKMLTATGEVRLLVIDAATGRFR